MLYLVTRTTVRLKTINIYVCISTGVASENGQEEVYKRFWFPKMFLGSMYCLRDFSIPKPTSETLSCSHRFRNLPTGEERGGGGKQVFNIHHNSRSQSILWPWMNKHWVMNAFIQKWEMFCFVWFIEPTRLSSSLNSEYSQRKPVLPTPLYKTMKFR